MPDEYAKVAKGKLKLKTDGEMSKKKKKKKDKDREKELEKIAYVDSSTVQIGEPSTYERKLTKAEQSFKKMQDKMVRRFPAFNSLNFQTFLFVAKEANPRESQHNSQAASGEV